MRETSDNFLAFGFIMINVKVGGVRISRFLDITFEQSPSFLATGEESLKMFSIPFFYKRILIVIVQLFLLFEDMIKLIRS